MAEVKLNKKVLYSVVITAIIVFILAYAIFKYIPEQSRAGEINSYKKAMFDSISCQYNCPLVEQSINNKTQLLPGTECVQSCTADFRALSSSNLSVKDSDLQNDNLLEDLSNIVDTCKTDSLNQSNLVVDTTKFFPCVSGNLTVVKAKYNYLN